jgi:hypothetical protein
LVLPAVLVAVERDGAFERVGGVAGRALTGAFRLWRRPRVA